MKAPHQLLSMSWPVETIAGSAEYPPCHIWFLSSNGSLVLAQTLICLVPALFLICLIFALKCFINTLLKEVKKNPLRPVQALSMHMLPMQWLGQNLWILQLKLALTLGKLLFLPEVLLLFWTLHYHSHPQNCVSHCEFARVWVMFC